jgi:hypothetical protein
MTDSIKQVERSQLLGVTCDMATKRYVLQNDGSECADTEPSGIRRVDWHKLHDIFNILALPVICVANILYLRYNGDSLLWLQFYLFTLYLLVDTIWVVLRPQSVSSPSTIISHHILCLIGWIVPHISDPSLCRWTALGVLVEINTFFLIGRRVFGRTIFMQIAFYTTWILLRLVLFPIILYLLVFVYIDYSATKRGNYFNTALFILVTSICLNILNLKWSSDLFLKPQSLKKKESRGL